MPQLLDDIHPVATPESLDADINRRQVQARAWKKRARQIHRLRILLPGLIIGIVLLLVAWVIVQSVLNSLNVYGANTGDIRMLNPLYTDRGDDGSRYTLRGAEAVRRGNTPIITLTAPRVDIRSESERASQLEAVTGIYNNNDRTITFKKDVVVTSSQEFNLKTQDARIDLKNSTVAGNSFVEGQWANGDIQAQSFRIEDNGNRIYFNGKGEQKVTGTLKNVN
ncbi:MAG: LPS export ABC transporter periplasmic protein LptC [Asticcacaulis sp.]